MGKLSASLDGLHRRVISIPFFQLATAFIRILLVVGFTPPSLVKVVYRPFTLLPETDPVGAYFWALYRTGYYYQFIGLAQLLAALLLLFPRTAHLGALLFLPVIVNIAVLTNSVGFGLTGLITVLMTLAAAYLVAWDYDRLKPILFGTRTGASRLFAYEIVWLPVLLAVGGAILGWLGSLIRVGNLPDYVSFALSLSGLGFAFGVVVGAHHRFMKVGPLV